MADNWYSKWHNWLALAVLALTLVGWTAENHQRNFADPRYRLGAVCADGTETDATRNGACSGHGGVHAWVKEAADSTVDVDLPEWARPGQPLAVLATPWWPVGLVAALGIHLWGERREIEQEKLRSSLGVGGE